MQFNTPLIGIVIEVATKFHIPIGIGSNYQYWFISTGFYRYWLLPVNSPTAVHIRKHVFPKGCNDRYTVGEFFSTSFYQYYTRHSAQVKNIQNESCKY